MRNYRYAVVRIAIVDLVAYDNIGSNIQLSKNERRELAHVLHHACIVGGIKVNVMSAIDIMVSGDPDYYGKSWYKQSYYDII